MKFIHKKREKISCNMCGKVVEFEEGILKEDFFEATKDWGYFSRKDLQTHRFNLCEECYDSMVSKFVIPMIITDKKEAL